MNSELLLEKVSTSTTTLPDQQITNQYKDLKVVGLVADNGACGHYRVINPLHMLKQHGAQVQYSSIQNLQQFIDSDIIVAPRQHNPEAYEMFRILQWEGKFLWFEIDDDLHTVLPTNPAYSVYQPGSDNLVWLEKFMRNSQGMTVTTEELKQTYDRFNQNIEVVGNYIDFSLRNWNVNVSWQNGNPIFEAMPIRKPKEWEDKIVIMYSGGSSHLTDLEQIFPVMAKILNDYPQTHFAFYGAPDLFGFLNSVWKIPEGRYTLVEPRHFLDHPVGLFGADIGLAPIHPCAFNASKSNLKLLEGFAAGQAMIASNVAPYSKLARQHPESTLIVGQGKGNYDTWYKAIEKLVVDHDLRNHMQLNNRKLAVTDYSLEVNFHRWPMAWRNGIENAKAGKLGPNLKSKRKAWGVTDRNDPCPCGTPGAKYKNCCRNSHG